MPDFSKRSEDLEIMDDLTCSGEVVDQTLRELENINRLLGGNDVTLDGLMQLIDSRERPIHISDLGCGSGDMLRLIRRWSLQKKLNVQLTGYDANPFIVRYALDHTPENLAIAFKVADIFSDTFAKERFDIVIGTLFFHHFNSEELSSFFRQLKSQVSTGIIVNDIHRHWIAYYSIRWLTKLFSRSTMVRHDGPLSVLRAFSKKELVAIMELAGIRNYRIRWMWAFRWQLIMDLRQ